MDENTFDECCNNLILWIRDNATGESTFTVPRDIGSFLTNLDPEKCGPEIREEFSNLCGTISNFFATNLVADELIAEVVKLFKNPRFINSTEPDVLNGLFFIYRIDVTDFRNIFGKVLKKYFEINNDKNDFIDFSDYEDTYGDMIDVSPYVCFLDHELQDDSIKKIYPDFTNTIIKSIFDIGNNFCSPGYFDCKREKEMPNFVKRFIIRPFSESQENREKFLKVLDFKENCILMHIAYFGGVSLEFIGEYVKSVLSKNLIFGKEKLLLINRVIQDLRSKEDKNVELICSLIEITNYNLIRSEIQVERVPANYHILFEMLLKERSKAELIKTEIIKLTRTLKDSAYPVFLVGYIETVLSENGEMLYDIVDILITTLNERESFMDLTKSRRYFNDRIGFREFEFYNGENQTKEKFSLSPSITLAQMKKFIMINYDKDIKDLFYENGDIVPEKNIDPAKAIWIKDGKDVACKYPSDYVCMFFNPLSYLNIVKEFPCIRKLIEILPIDPNLTFENAVRAGDFGILYFLVSNVKGVSNYDARNFKEKELDTFLKRENILKNEEIRTVFIEFLLKNSAIFCAGPFVRAASMVFSEISEKECYDYPNRISHITNFITSFKSQYLIGMKDLRMMLNSCSDVNDNKWQYLSIIIRNIPNKLKEPQNNFLFKFFERVIFANKEVQVKRILEFSDMMIDKWIADRASGNDIQGVMFCVVYSNKAYTKKLDERLDESRKDALFRFIFNQTSLLNQKLTLKMYMNWPNPPKQYLCTKLFCRLPEDSVDEMSEGDGGTGLKNLGNTCYINAVFTQLAYMSSFTGKLFDERNPDPNTKDFTAFKKIIYDLTHSFKSYLDTSDFCNSWIICDNKKINVKEQNDAPEFFMRLIDWVNKYVKNISSQFEFTIGEDKYKSKTLNIAMNEISKSDENMKITDYIQKYHPISVSQGTKSIVVALNYPPDSYDTINDTDVNPIKLIIGKEIMPINTKVRITQKFKLSGIICRSGNSQFGHFFSFVLTPFGWYEFNDKLSRKVEESYVFDIANLRKVNTGPEWSRGPATMLFYNKVGELGKAKAEIIEESRAGCFNFTFKDAVCGSKDNSLTILFFFLVACQIMPWNTIVECSKSIKFDKLDAKIYESLFKKFNDDFIKVFTTKKITDNKEITNPYLYIVATVIIGIGNELGNNILLNFCEKVVQNFSYFFQDDLFHFLLFSFSVLHEMKSYNSLENNFDSVYSYFCCDSDDTISTIVKNYSASLSFLKGLKNDKYLTELLKNAVKGFEEKMKTLIVETYLYIYSAAIEKGKNKIKSVPINFVPAFKILNRLCENIIPDEFFDVVSNYLFNAEDVALISYLAENENESKSLSALIKSLKKQLAHKEITEAFLSNKEAMKKYSHVSKDVNDFVNMSPSDISDSFEGERTSNYVLYTYFDGKIDNESGNKFYAARDDILSSEENFISFINIPDVDVIINQAISEYPELAESILDAALAVISKEALPVAALKEKAFTPLANYCARAALNDSISSTLLKMFTDDDDPVYTWFTYDFSSDPPIITKESFIEAVSLAGEKCELMKLLIYFMSYDSGIVEYISHELLDKLNELSESTPIFDEILIWTEANLNEN